MNIHRPTLFDALPGSACPRFFRPISRSIAFATVSLLVVASLNAATAVAMRNETLLAALEPLESLTEAAIGGSAARIEKNLTAAVADRAAVRALLGADAARRYDTLFTDVTAAQSKHDPVAGALAAAELYKVVALALDPGAMTIPREVSLLDYVGFRTKALLARHLGVDWSAVASTAREANGYWAAIRTRVTDLKLQGAMDQAQRDLLHAAEKQDAKASASATRADLDLVDELEKHFSK